MNNNEGFVSPMDIESQYSYAPEIATLPLHSETEYAALVSNMKEHGFSEAYPIIVFGNEIFDGRNRYSAASDAGVEPEFHVCLDREEALRCAEQSYLQRVFTKEQKLAVSMHFATLKRGGDRQSEKHVSETKLAYSGGKSLDKIAEETGESKAKVAKAASVKNKVESGDVSPEIRNLVLDGKDTNNAAFEAVKQAEQIAEATGETTFAVTEEIASIAKDEDISLSKAVKKYSGQHLKGNGDDEWYTPTQYTDKARLVMGAINIDPASNDYAQSRINADAYYTKDNSSLEDAVNWEGKVWMNPPYSKGENGCEAFVTKLCSQVNNGNATDFIALTNSQTDTGWSQALMDVSSLVAFPKGRIKFDRHPDHVPEEGKEKGAMKGQVFFYRGGNEAAFIEQFSDFCTVLRTIK